MSARWQAADRPAQVGLEEILKVPNGLRHILLCSEHLSTAQQTVTLEFLCAACLVSEDAYRCAGAPLARLGER